MLTKVAFIRRRCYVFLSLPYLTRLCGTEFCPFSPCPTEMRRSHLKPAARSLEVTGEEEGGRGKKRNLFGNSPQV